MKTRSIHLLFFGLLSLSSCARKTKEFQTSDLPKSASASTGASASGQSNESDLARLNCLGMPSFDAVPKTGETELESGAELKGSYSVVEIRFYSEILEEGVPRSSIGSNTEVGRLIEGKTVANARVLCDSGAGGTNSPAVGKVPAQITFPAGSIRFLGVLNHLLVNGRASVSASVEKTASEDVNAFDLAEGRDPSSTVRFRVFRNERRDLRVRFRTIESLSREKDLKRRLDAEVFYERTSS